MGGYNTNTNTYYHSIGYCKKCNSTSCYQKNGINTNETCIDKYGNLITCANRNICMICQKDYSTLSYISHQSTNSSDNQSYYCSYCNQHIYTELYKSAKQDKNNNYHWDLFGIYQLPNNIKWKQTTDLDTWSPYLSAGAVTMTPATVLPLPNEYYNNPTYNTQGIYTNLYLVKYEATIKSNYQGTVFVRMNADNCFTNINGNNYEWGKTYSTNAEISPDIQAPSNLNINVSGNGTINNFSKKAIIEASCTELYSDTVEIALYDLNNNMISNWGNAIKNGFIFTRTFDVVAEIKEPQSLIVKFKDRFGNISTSPIQVQYIDAKAPELTCNLSYKENWSKSKIIDFTSKDYGIGNISVAFNNLTTYNPSDKINELENNYSHPIRFIGDVYESVVGAVYIKDGLGNQRMQKVEIGKLDNTAPTITTDTVKVDSEKKVATIQVEANDISSILKASGSGVNGYSIVKAGDYAENFQKENILQVNENGIYDIYVTDLVGNISQPRRIEVKGIPIQVICKDVLKGTNTVLGEQSSYAVIGSSLTGSSYGSDKTKNLYYKGYLYDSATTILVSENQTTVYRYFLPLYQIGTSITNGTITPSGIDIIQNENYPITYTANVGFYISNIIVDGIEIPIQNNVTNYTFTSVTSSHTIQVETRVLPTVMITKEIRKDNTNFNTGNPIFQFKIEGTDYLGKPQSYTKYIEFTEAELSGTGKWQKSLVLTDIEPGLYTVSELPIKDYVLNKIENIKNTNITNYIVTLDTYNYSDSSYLSKSILKGKAVNADSDSKLNIFDK